VPEQHDYRGTSAIKRPNIPGFTAEISIGLPRNLYSGARYEFTKAATRKILPQMRGLQWRPKPNCNPNCACLSFVDCPCCIGPGPGGGWSLSSGFSRT
jgi:hypothetical protein